MSSFETVIKMKSEINDMTEKTGETRNILKVIKNVVSRQFFPLGTVFVILFGIFVPQPTVYIGERLPLIKICVVTMFLMFGLRFRLVEVKSALRSYKEIVFGFVFVLFVTPLIGANILKLVPQFEQIVMRTGVQRNLTRNNSANFSDEQLQLNRLPIFGPQEFQIGLQIFFISPCSSAFATLMVSAANGNRAVSLLVSILCLIVSVFTVPAMMVWLIPAVQNVTLSVWSVLLNVVSLILLPLVVGRGLRFVPIMKKMAVKLDTPLKFASSCSLLAIFLVKISETSANGNIEKISPLSILATTALGTGIICTYLAISLAILSLLPLPKTSTIALAILSCARHMSMSTTIIDILPDSVGDKGLMVFPIVFVYLASVLVINIFVSVMKVKQVEKVMDSNESIFYEQQVDKAIQSNTNTAMDHDSASAGCKEVVNSVDSAVSKNSDTCSGSYNDADL